MFSIPACASGLVLALLVHLCGGWWNFLNDNGHRMRHKRNWKIDRDRYQYEEAATCPGNRRDHEFITCPPKRCLTNGDCWTQKGSAQFCFCDPHLCGLVCISINTECPTLEDIKNGRIKLSPAGRKNSPPGSHAIYTCNDGFTLHGVKKRTCRANGKWTKSAPKCKSQQFCDRPPLISMTINDANITQKKYLTGHVITYRCQAGYSSTVETSKMICAGVSGWKGAELNCRRIKCQMPRPLKNGKYINRGLHYQGTIVYYCHEGYKLVCNSISTTNKKCQVRKCQANGKWDGTDGYCEKIRCPELLVPVNGKIKGTPNFSTVNSIITFECNPGFYLLGSKTRRCQKDGQWDGEDAKCKLWNCGLPPFTPFANIDYNRDNTSYGATARYECKRNSSFYGKNKILRCGDFGMWIPQPPPKCYSHCTLLKIANGSIQMGKISKGIYSRDSNVVPHAYTVSVNCSTGYKLKDNVHPRCDNGSWSDIPVCEPASCSSRPPKGTNSKPRFYSLHHGSKAKYSCFFGFERKYGDKVVTCHFGKWVGIPLKCAATACPSPVTPKNGVLYIMGSQGGWKYTPSMHFLHNQVIEYRCLKNYRRNGQRTAVCLNRRWRPSEPPTCDFILHKKTATGMGFVQTSQIKTTILILG